MRQAANMPLQSPVTATTTTATATSTNTAKNVRGRPVKPFTMTYPLDNIESNVSQTWSSLEILSADFASMWHQIGKLESIMTLQRKIMTSVDEPTTSDVESAIQNNFGADSQKKEESSSSQFPYNLPPSDKQNSWGEFFSMPATTETSFSGSLGSSSDYHVSNRNNLNKKDIPLIRLQSFCDSDAYEKNIDVTGSTASEIKLERPSSNNGEYDDYKKDDKPVNLMDYHYLPSSAGLPKSQSWLGLDNASKSDVLLQESQQTQTYYSPQPKRKFTDTQSSRVGFSCPRLDTCVLNTGISPAASSSSFVSKATEYSSLSKSDFCSPVEAKYHTNPFLYNYEEMNEDPERLISATNFIVRPTNDTLEYDNVINTLIQFHTRPGSPESPPPPAPQDCHTYNYYPETSSYNFFDDQYDYDDHVNQLYPLDDSDPEDIISKIDYLYETQFQRPSSRLENWREPNFYKPKLTDETLDLIDQLQENYQLRNMLAAAKYKSWTNIPERSEPIIPSPYRSSLLRLDEKARSRQQLTEESLYGNGPPKFRGSKSRLHASTDHFHEPIDRIPSVYSLAGTDAYTSVYTSGVALNELPSRHNKSRTPDLINSSPFCRQRVLDKNEIAKNFPTHSYKPEEPNLPSKIQPSPKPIRPASVARKRSDSATAHTRQWSQIDQRQFPSARRLYSEQSVGKCQPQLKVNHRSKRQAHGSPGSLDLPNRLCCPPGRRLARRGLTSPRTSHHHRHQAISHLHHLRSRKPRKSAS
jgi:hypothetical protein